MTGEAADYPAPRENPDLRGHGDAEQAFHRAFDSRRLPHAWLITGVRGIGKATLAYRFARFVLSGGGGGLFGGIVDDLGVDTEHPVFRRVASGGHSDLMVLERRPDEKGKLPSVIQVGDVRKAVNFLQLTAGEGGWRVLIVDSADEMNVNAANALLKALEEPRNKTLLLLVSHAPGQLLPTIRSRCSHLALSVLSEADVLALLLRYRPTLAPEDATALARLGAGSIGHALALAESGGLDLYREMVAILASLPRLDVPRLHAFGDKLARGQDGAAFATGMSLLIWWLGRMLRTAPLGAPPAEVVEGEAELMTRLSKQGNLEQWLDVWEKISRIFRQAERVNLDRKQVVLSAFLTIEAL